MLNKTDKLIQLKLYTPHKCEFFYERNDGTRYVHSKLEEEGYYELIKVQNNKPNDEKMSYWTKGEKIK